MGVETTQVRISLTNDKKILNQMRRNKVLRKDVKGEVFVKQFDAKIFEFRPGQILTLGESIAKGLFRDSAIILDDHLTGEMVPCLVKCGEYNLGVEVSPEEASRATSCPVCKQDCHSLPRLARHILSKHKNDRADLFPEEDKDTEAGVNAELNTDPSVESGNEDAENNANPAGGKDENE